MNNDNLSSPNNQNPTEYIASIKPPTVLGNFLQPSFPFARVYSVFFLPEGIVFAKTGSGGTNAGGTMQSSLGGFNPLAMVAGAIGSLFDAQSASQRANKTGQLAAQSAAELVASHKQNFMVTYNAVKSVEIRGPNWGNEVGIIVIADKTHKFRVDQQSKESAKYISDVFTEFLPGKVKTS